MEAQEVALLSLQQQTLIIILLRQTVHEELVVELEMEEQVVPFLLQLLQDLLA